MTLLFGTAGIPLSARLSTTPAGIERVAELGLSALEIQFVQGVKMTPLSALAVAKVATKSKVALSVHAPYYINLNAQAPEKVKASQQRILDSARIAQICGAQSVVFHAGFYLGDAPAQVYATIRQNLQEVQEELEKEGNKVWLRPEVMGKASQFGSLEEVLELSQELPGVAPCLDFSHWHARTGRANSSEEFGAILGQIEKKLDKKALDHLHIHLSGIDYGKAGEKKHILLEESDLRYRELLRALKERKAGGVVICESPNLEDDALLLQQTYHSLL